MSSEKCVVWRFRRSANVQEGNELQRQKILMFIYPIIIIIGGTLVKVKVIPQQAEVAQGVPDRLRPWIFLTFGTTRVIGRQPYAPAAFTPGEIPGTHFQGLSRPQGTWLRRGTTEKIPSDTIGNRSRDLPQCLNHYATPGPETLVLYI